MREEHPLGGCGAEGGGPLLLAVALKLDVRGGDGGDEDLGGCGRGWGREERGRGREGSGERSYRASGRHGRDESNEAARVSGGSHGGLAAA